MAAVFRIVLAVLLLSSIASLAAQTVTLSVSPVAPPDEWVNARTIATPLVATALRLDATATAEVTGLVLTCGGSGDWTTDLDPADGVSIWLDDGDGQFDSGTDVLLFQGAGAPSVQANFVSVLTVNSGTHADLWVVLTFVQGAGFGATASPEIYDLAVASAADVLQTQTSAATAVLGTLAPETTVSLLDFSVTNFDPLTGLLAGGESITIDGTGFVLPFAVWVGGVLCPGVTMVTGGTQVTGLIVPAGTGIDLPITINSGFLPPITIAQQFSYKTQPPPPPPPSTLIEIVTTSMPPAEVGKPYEATIRCTGGTGSYAWGSGLNAGALPQGLALSHPARTA